MATVGMIKYKKGYKYQLAEEYHHQLPEHLRPDNDYDNGYLSIDKSGFMKVFKGYAWDGPSGPTWDTKNSLRGALVHDCLYQLIRLGYISIEKRKDCDQFAYEIWTEDGMWKWRAKLWLRALKKCAEGSARPSSERPIFMAP